MVSCPGPTLDEAHEIIGVEPGSNTRQLREAFNSLALKYHPDKVGNTPEANSYFIRIYESYEALLKSANAAQQALKPGLRSKLDDSKKKHESLSRRLKPWIEDFLQGMDPVSEEARGLRCFRSGFRHVGMAIGNATGNLDRLAHGAFGQETAKDIDVFADDNRKFLERIEHIIGSLPKGDAEYMDANSSKGTVGLRLLKELARAPIQPPYFLKRTAQLSKSPESMCASDPR